MVPALLEAVALRQSQGLPGEIELRPGIDRKRVSIVGLIGELPPRLTLVAAVALQVVPTTTLLGTAAQSHADEEFQLEPVDVQLIAPDSALPSPAKAKSTAEPV